MFKRFFSTAKQSTAHLRKYNPFIEFKSDLHRSIDHHILHNNTIHRMHGMLSMSLMFIGFTTLYAKTEADKVELNNRMDQKLREMQMNDHKK